MARKTARASRAGAKTGTPVAGRSKPATAAPARRTGARKAAAKRSEAGPSLLAPAAIEAMFARLAAANPEPKSELEHSNAFTLLVAVVLSAQATDAGVNKATRALFALADTPAAMVALGEERVRDLIKTIGLFRNKAKNTIALSERLLAEHGGEVPRDREALERLPGVGRKTANVVLNVAFGEPTIAVDTHILRVSNRTGLAPGKTPDKVEEALLAVVPAAYRLHAHHWLILHGRYVCIARAPKCASCAIADLCRFEEKTSTARPATPAASRAAGTSRAAAKARK
jgi:endonuclease-3